MILTYSFEKFWYPRMLITNKNETILTTYPKYVFNNPIFDKIKGWIIRNKIKNME